MEIHGLISIWGHNTMKNAVYGTYRNGQVFFDEPVPAQEETKVVVVFLDEGLPKPRLKDMFARYGTWEDTRTADEIVAETRSRIDGTILENWKK
jgi:hypothetical protein